MINTVFYQYILLNGIKMGQIPKYLDQAEF